MRLAVSWGTFNAVELTQDSDGVSKQIDQNGDPQPANNQTALYKSRTGTFTFSGTVERKSGENWVTATPEDLELIKDQSYYVAIGATGTVRIDTARSGSTSALAPGEDNKYVGAYTASTYIPVGQITIRHATASAVTVTFEYSATLDINTVGNADESLNFYYSVSPEVNDGPETKEVGDAYGAISVYVSATAFTKGGTIA